MSLALARRPSSGNWRRHPDLHQRGTADYPDIHATVWSHASGARVLSAVEWVTNEDGRVTKEWHVSVSFNGGVADDLVMAMVHRDFGVEDAFEDNHQPGIVRNLWLAIDPSDRKPQCSCVESETPHEQGCRLWRDAPPEVSP